MRPLFPCQQRRKEPPSAGAVILLEEVFAIARVVIPFTRSDHFAKGVLNRDGHGEGRGPRGLLVEVVSISHLNTELLISDREAQAILMGLVLISVG
jgi:hypothetical protein